MLSIVTRTAIAACSLLGMCLLATSARADNELPTFKVLACEEDCPNVQPALAIDAPKPEYPLQYRGMMDVYVEALVDVDFTIRTDGSVANAVVEKRLGPEAFATAALDAVNQRKYKPATENGQPVEENHRVRFMFAMREVTPGAREEVVRLYNSARSALRDNKLDEGIAKLKAIEQRDSLNFYERTFVANTLTYAYALAGNFDAARIESRTALISNGAYLDKHVLEPALRLAVRVEAKAGQYADSLYWFDVLTTKREVAADDPDRAVVDQIKAMLASPRPIPIEARIPDAGGDTVFWQHTLLRRSFQFDNVAGKLDRFTLRCARHAIESPITLSANWTVPKSWSGCVLNVYGDPATRFRVVEFPAA